MTLPTSVVCDTCGKSLLEADAARLAWARAYDRDGTELTIELHYCADCVRQEDRERMLDAYRDALELVTQELRAGRLLQNVWRRVHEALGWLYMLDELHDSQRKTRLAYRQHRLESPDGRATAGLVWARGKAVHTGWQFEATDRRWVIPGIGFFDVMLVTTTVWADRDTTRDEPGAKEYAEHVSGKPLLEPLQGALRFLEGLDETY